MNTGGRWKNPASWRLQIFRIERDGDEERWNADNWDKMGSDADRRRLVWHGTAMASIQIILKQGLKDVKRLGGIFFSDTARTRYIRSTFLILLLKFPEY